MTLGELAAFVCTYLKKHGIDCVLSGGACVSIYTTNQYQSYDLDFIENISTGRKKLRDILAKIGFSEENRYFKHPDTKYFIEFPPGPLAVGDEPVRKTEEIKFCTGRLNLLSPTDCIKDRLAAYYHWDDRQSLEQALLVAEYNTVNLPEIFRWSKKEGKKKDFEKIRKQFILLQKAGNKSP